MNHVSPNDTRCIIEEQVRAAHFFAAPARLPRAAKERVFFDNNGLWEAILLEQLYAQVPIKLESFFIFDWFPRSPGLWWTDAGRQARAQAQRFVEAIDEDVVTFNPYGKFQMLQGGIGCIRLRSRRVSRTPLWFVSASSTGECDQGFPIAIPQNLYDRIQDELRTRGAACRTLVGELRFVPRKLTLLYRDFREVPQLYLRVHDLKPPSYPRSRKMTDLRVNVAISFASAYEGQPRVYASYATFDPARPDSIRASIDWLDKTYVKHRYEGKVLTDFDERASRFESATFSLSKVLGKELVESEVVQTFRELHLPGDPRELLRNLTSMKIGALNMSVNVGDHAHVGGDIVVAGDVRNSFNQEGPATNEASKPPIGDTAPS